MFTAEIRINGRLVSHVYGHNIGELPDGTSEYSFERYDVEKRGVHTGKVTHARGDGINALVAKILTSTEP